MPFTITNYLDDVALYQNLVRLAGETNEDFTARIKSFATVKFGTDYLTQIKSVSLQTGLKKTPIIEFGCLDPYRIELSQEYIIFKSFSTDPEDYGSIKNYFRVFISDYIYWKKNLLSINKSANRISMVELSNLDIKGNFLLRNSNTKIVTDIISDKRTRFSSGNILPGSFLCDNVNCINRVQSIPDIKKLGDYFLDDSIGYLEIFGSNISSAFHVRYEVYEKTFIFYKNELSLQSLELFYKYGLNDKFINILPQLLNNKSIGA